MIYMPKGEDRAESLGAAPSPPQALLWEVSR